MFNSLTGRGLIASSDRPSVLNIKLGTGQMRFCLGGGLITSGAGNGTAGTGLSGNLFGGDLTTAFGSSSSSSSSLPELLELLQSVSSPDELLSLETSSSPMRDDFRFPLLIAKEQGNWKLRWWKKSKINEAGKRERETDGSEKDSKKRWNSPPQKKKMVTLCRLCHFFKLSISFFLPRKWRHVLPSGQSD